MPLKWTELADGDLEKIYTYIAGESGDGLAIDAVLNIVDTTHLILLKHPRAGRPGRLKGSRELVIDGLPFIVVYQQDDTLNQLHILRVLHEAQQWPTADNRTDTC